MTDKLRSYIRNLIRKEMLIIKDEESEYQKFFKHALKKFGVSSPNELSDTNKKKFFAYIDDNFKAKNENDIEETSSISSMDGSDGYQTPFVFSKQNLTPKKKKALKNDNFNIVDESMDQLERPRIVTIKKGPNKNKKAKLTHYWTDKKKFVGFIDGKEVYIPLEFIKESVDFKNTELSPSHRMNLAVSTMRKSLKEISKLLNKSSKFKQENNITTDKYWIRTKNSLRKLSEDLITIMNKLNNIK